MEGGEGVYCLETHANLDRKTCILHVQRRSNSRPDYTHTQRGILLFRLRISMLCVSRTGKKGGGGLPTVQGGI